MIAFKAPLQKHLGCCNARLKTSCSSSLPSYENRHQRVIYPILTALTRNFASIQITADTTTSNYFWKPLNLCRHYHHKTSNNIHHYSLHRYHHRPELISHKLQHQSSSSSSKRQYSSLSSSDKVSHYDVLGIKSSATNAEIKKHYFQLAKKFHPDHNRNKPPEERRAAHKKYARMKEAYDVLMDSDRRKSFDLELKQSTSSSSPNASSSSNRSYYGSPKYSGSRNAASSLHRRMRTQTYHYYNVKHKEYSSEKAKAERANQTDASHLKDGYKSGSNYDVPHFDFDQHFRKQHSYEQHRKRQNSMKMEKNSSNPYHGINNKKGKDNPFAKRSISVTPGGIIMISLLFFSSIYFSLKIFF